MSLALIIPTDGNQLDHLEKAIASWLRYGPAFNLIMVVGVVEHVPESFLKQGIILISMEQRQRHPQQNQQKALARVLADPGLSTDFTFVWSHDDIFLTQPVELADLRALTYSAVKEDGKPKRGQVIQKLENTKMALLSQSLSTYNYELHVPLVIEPGERAKYIRLLEKLDDRHQFRTYVMNHLIPQPMRHIKDVKIFHEDDPLPTHAYGIYSTGKKVGLIDGL